MAILGKHFFQTFETLENETVIWEGGPSKKSFWAAYIDTLLLWVGLFIFIWFIGTMILVLPTLETENKCASKKHNHQSQETETIQKSVTSENKNKTKKFPTTLYIISILTGSIVLLLIVAIISKLKLKTYWYVVTTERVCIQQGIFEKRIVTIDLDKAISIQISQSFIEKFFNLTSIELIHGGINYVKNNLGLFQSPNQIRFLDSDDTVTNSLINVWLPRDNQR